jgi:hypothetical protein
MECELFVVRCHCRLKEKSDKEAKKEAGNKFGGKI